MNHKINAFRVKLVIFLGMSLTFPLFIESYSLTKVIEGKVTQVLDGDTLIVQGQKIRLYGIDAPELAQRSFDGKFIGIQSRKFLEHLVLNKPVRVEYQKRGYYGRIIGRVYTKIDINLEMLKSGMAIMSRYSKRRDFYLTSYLARLKRKGIFKTNGFLNPSAYRQKKRP